MFFRRDDIAARLRAHLPLDVHLAVAAAARHVPHLPALAAAGRGGGGAGGAGARDRLRRAGGADGLARRLLRALRHLHQYVAAQAAPVPTRSLWCLPRRRGTFSAPDRARPNRISFGPRGVRFREYNPASSCARRPRVSCGVGAHSRVHR